MAIIPLGNEYDDAEISVSPDTGYQPGIWMTLTDSTAAQAAQTLTEEQAEELIRQLKLAIFRLHFDQPEEEVPV